MAKKKNKTSKQVLQYLGISYDLAKINLGSTGMNPSVGCVVEKNGSIISSGYTSMGGRPHAEFNALNKKINFRNSNLFVTLEPCTHYGKTPPCTNLIIKKKIKNVFYSANDPNPKINGTATIILNKKKIKTNIGLLKEKFKIFYRDYFLSQKKDLPLVDGKIAVSKDMFIKSKKDKWITNDLSRKVSHLIRSKYNCLISTSKTINDDNPLLSCRINGLENKTPDLIIIDRFLKIRKDLKIFKKKLNRKIIIFTCVENNKKKIFFKSKGVILKKIHFLKNKNDFILFFKILKKMGYYRIFFESGSIMSTLLLKYKLLNNIYLFRSDTKLKKNGFKTFKMNKKNFNNKNRINVNLDKDNLYKIEFN